MSEAASAENQGKIGCEYILQQLPAQKLLDSIIFRLAFIIRLEKISLWSAYRSIGNWKFSYSDQVVSSFGRKDESGVCFVARMLNCKKNQVFILATSASWKRVKQDTISWFLSCTDTGKSTNQQGPHLPLMYLQLLRNFPISRDQLPGLEELCKGSRFGSEIEGTKYHSAVRFDNEGTCHVCTLTSLPLIIAHQAINHAFDKS